MSVTQFVNFRRMKQILLQLQSYGLNPYEWRIDRSSLVSPTERLRIHHKRDTHFCFSGRVTRHQNGRSKLIELSLSSL